MMVYFAGGVGEHGRNCFLVEGKELSFLVDCGKMAGTSESWPRLDPRQIQGLTYVFLTHSHADHTGALPWLLEQGFTGTVVASRETLEQLPFSLPKTMPTEDAHLPEGLKMRCGRTGHCGGSLWYGFELEGKKLLFTGDYIEQSLMYVADPIRNTAANLALVDCAYGSDAASAENLRYECLVRITAKLALGRPVMLPVPKYGRGLELLVLLSRAHPGLTFYGDRHFLSQLQWAREDCRWCRPDAQVVLKKVTVNAVEDVPPEDGVCFVSDPQLKSEESRRLAQLELAQGGRLYMTGTPEKNSFSEELIKAGKMGLLRYPVHQNQREFEALLSENHFVEAVPFHTPELDMKYPAGLKWIE